MGKFRARTSATALALVGSAIVVSSFMLDIDASLRSQYPKAYRYKLLALAMIFYVGAIIATAKADKESWRMGSQEVTSKRGVSTE